jgi:hypothetical protein
MDRAEDRAHRCGSWHAPAARNAVASAPAALVAVIATVLGTAGSARADYSSGMSVQEQRFYDYGPSGTNSTPKGTSILDSANPMDLMNKIRKGTAMDDATNPKDAIDAALKELDAKPKPAGPSAPLVKAP